MIKNIIFDFGDVFINLDKSATERSLLKLGVSNITQEMYRMAQLYEMGLLSTNELVGRFREKHPNISSSQFKAAWNALLKDTPKYRLDFIKELSKNKSYRLFLLSNTNELHINWVQNEWGQQQYSIFKESFEHFYLSYEIKLRKPNFDIYEFVLSTNNLNPSETLFIDDTKENIEAAEQMGINIWNIEPGKEDVVELFTRKEFLL